MADTLYNPTPEELRKYTEEMPECRLSEYGNVNVQTKVLSRSAASTYVVDRESSGKTMSREDYDRDRHDAGPVPRRERHARDRRLDRQRPGDAHARPAW